MSEDAAVEGAGVLSLVATPIGNLEDITLRALRVLREADAVLAEDTRRTRGMLTHHGIGTRLISVHEHTTGDKLEALSSELLAGARYALVTDAGSPLVSDPGAALLERCVRIGVTVEAIPGPSAPIAALTVAGFQVPSFEFVGFLPRSGSKRTKVLERLKSQAGAIVLFEAPGRIADTLADLAEALGGARAAAVCRELTKMHEEVRRGTLSALAEGFAGRDTLGEITLVVGPHAQAGQAPAVSDVELDTRIDAGLDARESARDLAKALAEQLGLPKREVYERVLARRAARSSG